MREGLFFGFAAFIFLVCNLVSGWVDGLSSGAVTLLTSPMTVSSTVANVTSTVGFNSPGAFAYLIIEDEVLTYTGVNSTAFTGLTRGAIHPNYQQSSLAATHVTSSKVYTLDAATMDAIMAYDVNSVATPYGSFTIIDFANQAWNALKSVSKWMSFDYAFLKGPYNPVTATNDPSDIAYFRLALMALYLTPVIIGLILLSRRILGLT